MIKENGRVVAIDQDALWVETIQQSTCGSCVSQKGCGQSILNRFGAKPVYLRVLLGDRAGDSYRINETVELGIPDDIVVKGSLLVYLVPLLLMLVFMATAHITSENEVLAVVAAVSGFVSGAILVRWHSKLYRDDKRHQPIIVDDQTPISFYVDQK